MVQVPSNEEFQAIEKRLQLAEEEIEFLKSLLLGERWLTRKQAMAAIGCKVDKLRSLTTSRKITYRKEGKTPFYEVFSIRDYLTSQQIDSKAIDRCIISARFTG